MRIHDFFFAKTIKKTLSLYLMEKFKILGLSLPKLERLFQDSKILKIFENDKKAVKLLPKQCEFVTDLTSIVFQALYRTGSMDFDQMTSISLENRRLLSQHFDVGGGKAQLPAAFIAMGNTTANRIITPQHPFRFGLLAFTQSVAD